MPQSFQSDKIYDPPRGEEVPLRDGMRGVTECGERRVYEEVGARSLCSTRTRRGGPFAPQEMRHKTNLNFEAFLGARRARPGGYESSEASERPPPRTHAALRTRSHHAFRHIRGPPDPPPLGGSLITLSSVFLHVRGVVSTTRSAAQTSTNLIARSHNPTTPQPHARALLAHILYLALRRLGSGVYLTGVYINKRRK